jgi:serine protease Do
VTPGGPAAKAGLAKGDLVTGFDSKPITDSKILPRVVAATTIGKTVNIDVLRGGRKQTFHIYVAKLEEGPPDKAGKSQNAPVVPKRQSNAAPQSSKLAQLGLSLGVLDGAARAKFKLGGAVQGVVVNDVTADSPAADKNFRPGDVIVEVQSQKVKSPADVTQKIADDVKAGRKVELMLVNRGGDSTYVGLRLD